MNTKKNREPQLAKALLRRLSPSHLGDTAQGDFEEMFLLQVEQRGWQRAKFWYWRQVLYAVPLSFFWNLVMLFNYLKVTWRYIKRHKAFSLINIAGLALGMACCILILLWIQDELSWDRFHENADEIYRVSQKQFDGHLTPVTPLPLAPYLKTDFPEVVDAVRYLKRYKMQLKHGDNSFSENPLVADPSFFQIFSFEFVQGDPDVPFRDLRSMVITEDLAVKLFGDEDALGKTVSVDNGADFTISGVMKNVPHNSHLQFDCVLPFELVVRGRRQDDWRSNYLWTYVQLQKRSPFREFNQKIAGVVHQRDRQNNAELYLQPLTQLHLRPQGTGGPIVYVYIFAAMAVFVLIIACINFINLTTARSANRAREVGLRKVIGARRENLVKQFIGEAFLFSWVAAICALFLAALFLPAFDNLSGKHLSFGQDIVNSPSLILGIVGITLFTGLLSGIYPAVLLSSFQPVIALRATKSRSGTSRSPLLRRSLVVLQFSLSIFLMIGTFVIHQQLEFIKNRDLGFDKSHIVCSDSNWGNTDMQTLKDELLRDPMVENVTFSSQKMGEWESGAREDVKWEGRTPDLKITFEVIFCDYDYLATHRMEMVQGRFFSKDFPSDVRQAFVLNETAVQEMGFGERSPLGESLSFWNDYSGKVIGVVKDFHTQSLHDRIQPVIMAYNPGSLDNISIRINSENMPETLKFIEDRWQALVAGNRFEYFFLDEILNQRYATEAATGALLKYFTFLAIFISCIGLLGLVSFIAQQRTKEIGVRKVLGASVSSIITLLIKEFVLLVVLANAIAWPLAYVVVKKWLENFAYRTDIGIIVFALSSGLALVIAFLTVSLQSFKTATADPVDSLRYE